MSEKAEKKSVSDIVGSFLVKNRNILLSVFVTLFVVVICIGVGVTIVGKVSGNSLEKIDTITYTLTKDAADLSEEEAAAKRDAALASIAPFAKKGGIAGVRANMLTADLLFQKKDFENSRTAWLKVAKLQKKSYTAPIAYYNAAVCSEELNDLDNAVAYYENASNAEDFLLADHALFSLGRVNEAKGDFEGAQAAYKKISDDHPSDTWANIAMSRILTLQAEGKIK